MSNSAEVASVNVSSSKGTSKHPVESIRMDEHGITNDAHAGRWHRQVSLLAEERIAAFSEKSGRELAAGDFAENITVRGLDLGRVALLDRLAIGRVELEVTQIGKTCHGEKCAIFRDVGQCVMPQEGIFCRVVRGGEVRAGDPVVHHPRPLRFKIITLSDRAASGEYTDRSGPRIRTCLEQLLEGKRWHPEFESVLIPDDAAALRAELSLARESGVDVLFTTGGTGVGPRDITPETVIAFCDKIVPGIMEAIRVKFGSRKPNALLSRSVAAVAGGMLVFTLPGSERAVEEYVGEIGKTLEHLLCMLHGLDVHGGNHAG